MQTKDLTVKVAAEVDDVMLLVVKVVKTLRSSGDITSVLPEFIKAVEGVANVPAEVQENLYAVLRSVANRSVDVAEALLTPKV